MDEYVGSADWVVGSDHAGATLSFAVASALAAQHDFTEKGLDKTQLWKRFVIGSHESVLQVEELITTTGTLRQVREGLINAHEHELTFVPMVMTLVNRSGIKEFEGDPILSLVDYDIQTWTPEDCPLCAAGSERLKPKTHWAELTGK